MNFGYLKTEDLIEACQKFPAWQAFVSNWLLARHPELIRGVFSSADWDEAFEVAPMLKSFLEVRGTNRELEVLERLDDAGHLAAARTGRLDELHALFTGEEL